MRLEGKGKEGKMCQKENGDSSKMSYNTYNDVETEMLKNRQKKDV